MIKILLLVALSTVASGLTAATDESKPLLKLISKDSRVIKRRTLEMVETTKFADVDKSAIDKDFVPVKLKDFPVTVMTYNNPRKNDRYVSFVLVKTGQWESESVQALCDAFKQHGGKGNILDVGANIGAFALPLADCVRQHGTAKDQGLVAVEASPKNLLNLKAGIKKNGLDNINLYQYAVSTHDSPDTLTFFQSSWNQGKSRVHEGLSTDKEKAYEFQVPATTLDAISTKDDRMKKIFAMKMDIEGYEYYAMQGGSTMFKEHPPCIVFAEFEHTLPNRKVAAKFLEENGYTYKSNGGNVQNAWYEQKDMSKCVAGLV
jgi:FkbM family methyltransferase